MGHYANIGAGGIRIMEDRSELGGLAGGHAAAPYAELPQFGRYPQTNNPEFKEVGAKIEKVAEPIKYTFEIADSSSKICYTKEFTLKRSSNPPPKKLNDVMSRVWENLIPSQRGGGGRRIGRRIRQH